MALAARGCALRNERSRRDRGCPLRVLPGSTRVQPARIEFYRRGVGAVFGVDLSDARRVAIKVHRREIAGDDLDAVQDVQHAVADAGLPAPRPIEAPGALGAGIATVEELLDRGRSRTGIKATSGVRSPSSSIGSSTRRAVQAPQSASRSGTRSICSPMSSGRLRTIYDSTSPSRAANGSRRSRPRPEPGSPTSAAPGSSATWTGEWRTYASRTRD
jgi:hypothetical protein